MSRSHSPLHFCRDFHPSGPLAEGLFLCVIMFRMVFDFRNELIKIFAAVVSICNYPQRFYLPIQQTFPLVCEVSLGRRLQIVQKAVNLRRIDQRLSYRTVSNIR